MKKLFFILFLLLVLSSALFSNTKTEKVQVCCFGKNLSAVIRNALEQSGSYYLKITDRTPIEGQKLKSLLITDYNKNNKELKYVNSLKLIKDGPEIQMYEAEIVTYTKDEKTNEIFEYDKNTLLSYNGNEKIVNIPNNIEIIGQNAFINNKTCEKIVLPKNLKRIESGAFFGCENLKEVKLPENLDYIGAYAFYSCLALSKIDIPKNITKINIGTFSGSGINKLNVPKNVKNIEPIAFSECPNLTDVIIENTDFIGYGAFLSCKSLTNLSINCLNIDMATFCNCVSLKNVKFINEINHIGKNAFDNCAITNLNLSCHLIDNWAFYRNKNLKTVTLKCDKIGKLSDEDNVNSMEIFAECSSLNEINLDTEHIGCHALCDLENLTIINLNGPVIIFNNAINNCYKLNKITGISFFTQIYDNCVTDCFRLDDFPPKYEYHEWEEKKGDFN